MEGQVHGEHEQEITLNLDEFDIDSYDFKPVTKGLGFHEPKKKSANYAKKSAPVARSKETRVLSNSVTHQMPKKDYLQSTPLTVSDPSLMSGIEALYANQEVKKKEVKKEEKVIVVKKLKTASLQEQVIAFIVDLIVVLSVSAIVMASFYTLAARSFDLKYLLNFIMSSLPYVGTLSGLIFITYFSLTEPVGTFGKKLVGISSYHAQTEKRVTIRQSFIRASITLFSLALLGLPLILDFQGKLSESRVLKK